MPALSSPNHPREFSIIAYRAGAGERPENTLLACEHAVASLPNVIIELDVRRSADGVLVAFHDARLERTTNGTGELAKHCYASLSELDAGYKFQTTVPSSCAKHACAIPRVAELLLAFPDTRFILDLHSDHPQLPTELSALVRRCNAAQRVILASENARSLRHMQNQEPGWRYAATANEVRLRLLLTQLQLTFCVAQSPRIFMVPPHHGALRVITPRFLACAAKNHETVWAWVIDEPAQALALQAAGVNGIFTAFPSRFAPPSVSVVLSSAACAPVP